MLLSQRWSELTFIHWPVPAGRLRPLVHPALEIQEHGGTAWVAVTPFRIDRMRVGPIPLPPFEMPELNVRTYVAHGARAGVWFLSLDAGSRLAVLGARLSYRLPYVYARMTVQPERSIVSYRSSRPDGTGFRGDTVSHGGFEPATVGSFDEWAVERYRLYAGQGGSALWTAEIQHDPWRLAEAEVTLQQNDMLAVHGLEATGEAAPARKAAPVDVKIGQLRRVV
jgi:uncharacterized protein